MQRPRSGEGILPAPDFTFLTPASTNPLLVEECCFEGMHQRTHASAQSHKTLAQI